MTIEAMKQALEALEKDSPWREETITSLRQAIEQAEKMEPVPWQGCDLDGMVEAFDRVIEAHFFRKNPFHNPIDADAQMALRILRGLIPYMKQYTTPQPQQEPVKMVAYNCLCGRIMKFESVNGIVAPQREWVGLTDEELSAIYNQTHWFTESDWNYERAIEQALKEKNA
jgi:hypothetical protein